MKKIMSVIFLGFAAIMLVACGGKEFEVDGQFVAFEEGSNSLTWATVTIKDGEVSDIDIDVLQGKVDTEGKFAWNEQSKKELGYKYRMHGPAMDDATYEAHLEENNLLEWFEQAELIEAFYLQDLKNELSVDSDSYIDNVTNVTIKDGGYSTVIKNALENARNNKFLAFQLSDSVQISWVEVTTNKKGEVKEIFLDTLQSKDNVWNEQSKKELGYKYRMHGPAMSDDEYAKHLKDNNLLEWFEQAELIEKLFVDDIKGKVDSITEVTITTDTYVKLIKDAIALIK